MSRKIPHAPLLWLALVAAGCVRSSGPPGASLAQPITEAPLQADTLPSATVVEVNQAYVRVTFPTDTSGTWGWPSLNPQFRSTPYGWSMTVDGMDGPATIGLLRFQRDSLPEIYSTLAELVADRKPSSCSTGMVMTCADVPGTVSVEQNRLILTVTDRRAIARWFGMRPASARVYRWAPDGHGSPGDSVRIQYTAPQISEPDSATRADAMRGRRQYQASITSVTRSIRQPRSWASGDLWVAVGDSIALSVSETRCTYDVCDIGPVYPADSGWRVSDTTVVRLRDACDHDAEKIQRALRGSGCVIAYGLREGRTAIRVRGLHSSADTIPSREAPARSLERAIVVGRPVVRIAVASIPDTVYVGEDISLRVTGYDRAGRRVRNVPILVLIDMGGHNRAEETMELVRLRFEAPGRRRIIASLQQLADTIWANVVERPR